MTVSYDEETFDFESSLNYLVEVRTEYRVVVLLDEPFAYSA